MNLSDADSIRQNYLLEYERLEASKVFSKKEIKVIKLTRDIFERKLIDESNIRFKTLQNYCDYIAYERNIMHRIDERSKTQTSELIELFLIVPILNHMRNLYKHALMTFPEEDWLWLNYVDFCRFTDLMEEGTVAFERMLKHHDDKPSIWIRAFMWEYLETLNIDRAQDILLRGLTRHPDNPELYMEFINLMLNETSREYSGLYQESSEAMERSL